MVLTGMWLRVPSIKTFLLRLGLLIRKCLYKKTRSAASFIPTFWFRIAFTWWLGHFISRHLKVHFMLIKYTCEAKSQTLRMRYPFQSTNRPISYRYEWSFRIYMRDTVARFRTGVKFLPRYNNQGELTPEWLARHDILWRYRVNKYKAMRGNSGANSGRRESRPSVM